jgi:hypothetical protein
MKGAMASFGHHALEMYLPVISLQSERAASHPQGIEATSQHSVGNEARFFNAEF